ncbi:MAG TPA: DUF6279 family lipoprotein [Permianibacter sp.]|nr:DUF6279 family lipoprotein [Permianibacter sp.]
MTGQFLSKFPGRWLAVALATLALTGCTLGLIYPRLDSLVGWQVDRYLRLESGQERWLDERLEERLGWHQREQLPAWRKALAQLRDDIANDRMTDERLSALNDQTGDLIKASVSGLIDDTVQLASTLTEPQIEHLLAHLDEETEEFKEELAERQQDPDATERERFDSLLEDVEQWLGSVTDEQKVYLRDWQQRSIRWSDYTLDSRQRWREFIVASLAQRSDPVATRAAVERMFLNPASLRSEAYQAAIAQQTGHRRALQLYLLQTMTAKQKAHLLAELDDFLEDIDELLAEAR